jgi:hypothetical protein
LCHRTGCGGHAFPPDRLRVGGVPGGEAFGAFRQRRVNVARFCKGPVKPAAFGKGWVKVAAFRKGWVKVAAFRKGWVKVAAFRKGSVKVAAFRKGWVKVGDASCRDAGRVCPTSSGTAMRLTISNSARIIPQSAEPVRAARHGIA